MALNFANNNSLSSITALPASISGGGLNLISTQTASSSSTIDFTSGIDSTYKEYIFKFIDCHPSASSYFSFNMSADGGSNYNTTCTSTIFSAYHDEADSATALGYNASRDASQSTSFVPLQIDATHNDNDSSWSGTLHIFDPSNTTFVKHFIAQASGVITNPGNTNNFTAGYANTTSAINAVQFSFSSGNIDSGVIKLYGIS